MRKRNRLQVVITLNYFLLFFNGTNTDQANRPFCVIKSSTSNTAFFNIFINDRDNVVFSIGSIIDVVNPDHIEYYRHGVPIIFSNEQEILMLPMNHWPIIMCNDLETNKLKGMDIQHSIIQVGRILFLDTKCSGKFCDHQNLQLNNNKWCGWFSLKSSCYNIISMHFICFCTDTGETKMMSKFSSLKCLETLKKR